MTTTELMTCNTLQGQVEEDDEQAHPGDQAVHDEAHRQPAGSHDEAHDHGERADERRDGVPEPADQLRHLAERGAFAALFPFPPGFLITISLVPAWVLQALCSLYPCGRHVAERRHAHVLTNSAELWVAV